MRRDKVLVTGGAGFIGSHVCEALRARECLPVVLDNLSTGKIENLCEGCDFILGDVRDLALLNDLCRKVDSVVHLAAEPSVALSVEKPVETHGSNYVGTLNLLEAMRRAGLQKIVYASSAAVYPPSDDPCGETSTQPRPSSPYGLDKFAGEHALRIFGELSGTRGTSLRFFNIYGERQDPSSPYSGVISIFLARISKGEPITLHGTGEQTRDFVYVRDLARLIVDLLDDPEAPPLANVGTGAGTSLLELIATLEEVLGRKATVLPAPSRTGDILHSRADVGLLAARGQVPATSLREGLANLAAYGAPSPA
ncbi:MAG TPA: NAD-dependent epimerase/dehydratase family protein [Fimbriimonas sp.]